MLWLKLVHVSKSGPWLLGIIIYEELFFYSNELQLGGEYYKVRLM